jgi:hypothetical protein
MLITGGTFTSGVQLQKGNLLPIVSTPVFNATSENNWAGVTRTGSPAQVGNYLVFTGSQYLTTDSVANSTLSSNDVTYEFWLRTTGTNAGALLSKISPTIGYYISAVEISSSKLVPGYWTGTSAGYDSGNPNITRDEWQHYVVTYTTDGPLKTYYNGALVHTDNFSPEMSPRDYDADIVAWWLFKDQPTNFGNGGALTADFGEFRLYTRALTDAEVLQNFTATRGRWGI